MEAEIVDTPTKEPTIRYISLKGKYGEGEIVILDEDDYKKFSKYSWQVKKTGNYIYARRTIKINGISKTQLLHREILKASQGIQIDHINGNTLDNRKSNLRICSSQQNHANSKPRKGTSQYKGVRWRKDINKWEANIGIDGKTIYLGAFISELNAAMAYDKTAKEIYGEFALLNFGEFDARHTNN